MKYLKNYQQHNEGIKSTVAGIGLAGSLLMGTPDVKASKIDTSIEMTQTKIDGTEVHKMVNTLSEMRVKNCQDQELNNILDEIKSNVNNTDSAKFVEMFGKLSNHLEKEYGYKVGVQKVEEISQSKVDAIKDKPTELNFYMLMGWLGSICLALSGIPQAIQSYQDKHSHGISWGFLLLWGFGELFALTYVFNKLDMPMIFNYGINIFVVSMMLYYKLYPKKENIIE
jgi:uncharacterized protein with PQ loop repeat